MTSRQDLQHRTSNAQKRDPDAMRLSRFKERFASFASEAAEIRDELLDRLEHAVELAVSEKRSTCSVFFTSHRWSFPVQMLLYGPSKQRDPSHYIGTDFLSVLDVPTIEDVINEKFPGVTVTRLGTRVKISWK
jgi:hypothetical protein